MLEHLSELRFNCYDCRFVTFICGCFAHWHNKQGELVYKKPCPQHGGEGEGGGDAD